MAGNRGAAYLRTGQYGTSGNYNARVALHARFRTNPVGLNGFVFDRLLGLPVDARVLELGCGPGWLWRANAARVPAGWRVTLTDFSTGMVRETSTHPLGAATFRFAVADAQAIPFADGSFDAIIANHMLYHVPDRERAYAEMWRMLRPGGQVFATTIGRGHMRELEALVAPFKASPERPLFPKSFVLENGGEQLARWFADVTLDRHEDGLVVTEVDPLVAYARSMTRLLGATPEERAERLAGLAARFGQEIAEQGAVRL